MSSNGDVNDWVDVMNIPSHSVISPVHQNRPESVAKRSQNSQNQSKYAPR